MTEEKKQTAVEWLIHELRLKGFIEDGDDLIVIEHKALATEREQRFEDFQGGFQAATDAIIGANKSVQSKTYRKEAGNANG